MPASRSRSTEYPGAEHFLPPARSLASLAVAMQGCRGCPLFRDATQAVPGEGPRAATMFVVGEQPGNDEDLAGKPFVGPAGRVLDKALEAAGIDRTDVFLTNAVKHFKHVQRGTKRLHKRPTVRETSACAPWLSAEFDVVKPRLVVALGATAAQAIFGRTFALMKQRGRPWPTLWGTTGFATIHPSSVLRQQTSDDRAKALAMLVADLHLAKKLSSTPALPASAATRRRSRALK